MEITSCGLNGGPLKAEGTYPAVICCNLTNGKMPRGQCVHLTLPHIICKNEERFISEIGNGTLIGYKYFLAGGVCEFSIKYRTCMGEPKGKITVSLGENCRGTIEVSPSEGWVRGSVVLTQQKGTYPLYLTYEGEGLIDIISFEFNEVK